MSFYMIKKKGCDFNNKLYHSAKGSILCLSNAFLYKLFITLVLLFLINWNLSCWQGTFCWIFYNPTLQFKFHFIIQKSLALIDIFQY